jgi:hypothetical protein
VNIWTAEKIHQCFQEAGAWKDSWSFSRRLFDFVSAAGRMADAELSWKKPEFMSAVGKTVAMYYDICAYLDFAPDIANAKRSTDTYSVDLVNSAIAWAYTAFTMKERRSPSFGKLGSEEDRILGVVHELVDKQMAAQCIAAGIPITRFFSAGPVVEPGQISMIAAPGEKIAVPF